MTPRGAANNRSLIELLKELFPECEIISVPFPEKDSGVNAEASCAGIEEEETKVS